MRERERALSMHALSLCLMFDVCVSEYDIEDALKYLLLFFSSVSQSSSHSHKYW